MRKKAPKLDPVTQYATDVVARRVIASRLVVQACQRHLDDLQAAKAKGLEWRPTEAQRVIDFFAEVLILPENTDAKEQLDSSAAASEPRPFVLQPWQQFIAGSLFGWYTAQGFRRFREALIETAKGSGKTPLCAGILLYMLVADGERGVQCFVAATTREQAGYGFRDAEQMVNASPDLRAVLDRRVNNIAVIEAGSFLRPISAEKRGLDGKRVHGAMADELHEHPTATVVNKLRAGTKGRRNALILKPTNSGFDRLSVAWQHHEYSRKVLDGTLQNEAWFAFVCGLDPCREHEHLWFPQDGCSACDDWKTEGPHWLKANPNLGVSLPWQYVRERVRQAIGMPSEVSDVLRFNFCVWTQGANRAIDMGRWNNCPPLPADHELVDCDVYGGLDLGESDDFAAWARLYVRNGVLIAVKMRFWIPEAAIERFPNRPYQQWRRVTLPDGLPLLEITEGDVTDYSAVQERILQDCQTDGVIAIAYDPRSATETAQKLQGAGLTLIKTQQGFALHESITRVLGLIADSAFPHGRNQILDWMASNVVLVTGTMKGDKRLAKEKSPEKIDGFAAICTGADWAIVRRERTKQWNGEIIDLGDYIREGPHPNY